MSVTAGQRPSRTGDVQANVSVKNSATPSTQYALFTGLQLEKTNQTRVCRLVEHIVADKSTDSFRLLCDALVSRYKWLVRDLQADLKVERGEVKPSPEMLEETASLVHRS